MAFLLRHHPEAGGLTLDEAGWTDLPALVAALQKLARDPELVPADIVTLVESDRKGRYAVEGERIRAVDGHTFGDAPAQPDAATEAEPQARAEQEQEAPAARRTEGAKPRPTGAAPPDVLYLGTTQAARERLLAGEPIGGKGQRVLLVASEARAWKLARRQRGEKPCILYVDARRAHRGGVEFRLVNGVDYQVEQVPRRYVLNARADFRFQLSAGTVLWRGAPDAPEIALIRVGRDAGESWELPKGKLQRGEKPLEAALRETREELGLGDAALHPGSRSARSTTRSTSPAAARVSRRSSTSSLAPGIPPPR